jgi:PII-like signaling protein
VSERATLTVYVAETARHGGRLAADALLDLLAAARVEHAVLLRGTEGFGHAHRLHAERFPDTEPKLPLVLHAIDARERLEALLPAAVEAAAGGLVTLERVAPAGETPAYARLSVLLERHARMGGEPAHRVLVELLRGHGLDAATVLLGVDGLAGGERRRARFLGRNADTPLLATAVGPGEAVAALLPALAERLGDPVHTVERVTRDGPPATVPDALEKLTVHVPAHARAGTEPLALALVRRLREDGAAGATLLRSIWGFAGPEEPHGDRASLVRRTPALVVALDRPEDAARRRELVAELTCGRAVVTTEPVPGPSVR